MACCINIVFVLFSNTISFWWRRKPSKLVFQVFDFLGLGLITYLVLFLCAHSVIPLLKDSIGILMQRIPNGLEKNVHIAYQRVSSAACINPLSFVIREDHIRDGELQIWHCKTATPVLFYLQAQDVLPFWNVRSRTIVANFLCGQLPKEIPVQEKWRRKKIVHLETKKKNEI